MRAARTETDLGARLHGCPTLPGCPHCASAATDPSPDPTRWSFVDGVYCISLSHRDDRAADAARELHRVGLCGRALFYRPTRDRSAKRGCWESHRAVAMHASARGLRRALILEDDVLFTSSFSPVTVERIGAALASLPSDWMGFYLGHWALWAYPVGRNTLRCSALCTHAYVASERLLAWLGATPFERRNEIPRSRIGGRGIDTAFAALPGMYAFFPLVAVQRLVSNDHMHTPRRRIWPLRKLMLDLLVRSRLREYAIAYAMGANEKLAIALSPLLLPVLWASRRLGARRGSEAATSPAFPAAPDSRPRCALRGGRRST